MLYIFVILCCISFRNNRRSIVTKNLKILSESKKIRAEEKGNSRTFCQSKRKKISKLTIERTFSVKNKFVYLLLLDMSKAFNKINREMLIKGQQLTN